MPTYNAKCPKCEHIQEYFCKMSEREAKEALPDCEKCGTKMENSTTFNENGGFVLKGHGWFKKGGY